MTRTLIFAALALTATTAAATPPARTLEDTFWDYVADEDPLFATDAGLHTHDDKLPDLSAPALAKRITAFETFLHDFDHPSPKQVLPPADDLALMRHYAQARL